MTHPTTVLDSGTLREILVTDVGIDSDCLAEQADTTLADLGLDSLAQVELSVVLQNRHGVEQPPDDMRTMSFNQLVARLCREAA